MVEVIFWVSAVLLIYTYLGYPACLFLISRFSKKQVIKSGYEPMVSIVIPAFNEAKVIAATIENKLSLDYPSGKLEIIVVSDASEDETDSIVRSFESRGVKLIRQEPRAGKTSGLNLAVPQVKGEIVVFSDANSMYDKAALKELLKNFFDENVGYVTGKMVYTNPDGSIAGDGCSTYMKYENCIRSFESAFSSVVGVDGGIDAVRKKLYEPMRNDQLPDFVLPLTVVSKGYRVVYEPRAILKEQSLSDMDSEYRMRVRVSLRAMWALLDMRILLNVFRYPLYCWQLVSHKVMRYLAFIPLAVLFIVSAALISQPLYSALFFAQVVFYIFAAYGHFSNQSRPPIFIVLPHYFVVLNISCAHAFMRFLKGEKQVIWNPRVG